MYATQAYKAKITTIQNPTLLPCLKIATVATPMQVPAGPSLCRETFFTTTASVYSQKVY